MPRVVGVGGIFFKARDPARLRAWYARYLGFGSGDCGAVAFAWTEAQDERHPGITVWSPFPERTTYFDPSEKPFMINFRVDDLDGLLARLRSAGLDVDDHIERSEHGKFGWVMDPEGNRVELWEPADGL